MSGKAGPNADNTDATTGIPDGGNERFADRPGWLKEGVTTVLSWCTILPVTPPKTFDRSTGRRAMAMLPLPGVILGVLAMIVAGLGTAIHIHAFLLAVLIVALWLGGTRMMHLDGLADVADALGSYTDEEKARKILADSHTGAMGMAASGIVITLQAAAIMALLSLPIPSVGILLVGLMPVVGRIGGMVTCARPFAPFKATGFGGLIIGTIPKRWVAMWSVAAAVLTSVALVTMLNSVAGTSGMYAPNPDEQGLYAQLLVSRPDTFQWLIATPALAIMVSVAWAFAWSGHLNHRLKGLNGDCTGSAVETTTAVAGVVFAVMVSGIVTLMLGTVGL